MELRKSLFRNKFVEIASILFIVLWVYAAASKLIDIQQFKVQLGQSPMIYPVRSIIIWLVPVLEIVVAILLMFERTRQQGLYASLSLILLFTFYIIAITQFSEAIPCSCGGILENMSWNQHLVFNIFFDLIGIAAILLNDSSHSKYLLQQTRLSRTPA